LSLGIILQTAGVQQWSVIEGPRRLSESCLWELQRQAYRRLGPAAWNPGAVPKQATSNPVIAEACAEVVRAYLDDLRRDGVQGPVLLLDLGAGSGRFAFYLLRALCDGAPPALPWRLVMLDLAEANLEAYARHEALAGYVEQGLLDFAHFDADAPETLSLNAPAVVAFAMYFFCSIRADLYRVEGGLLHEMDVALENVDPLEWSEYPRLAGGVHDSILDAHRAAFASRDTTFPFPTGAFRCIDWLHGISDRLILVVADKGYARLEDMADLGRLPIAMHGGTFSCMVDVPAIADYAGMCGGAALAAHGSEDPLTTALFSWGSAARARAAWSRAFDVFGPWDAARLIHHLLGGDEVPAEAALRLLRLSRFDPYVLNALSSRLAGEAEEGWLNDALAAAVERSAESYFAIGDGAEHPGFAAGAILQWLGRFDAAMQWYDRFLKIIPNAAAAYNRALCLLDLDRREEALAGLDRALEIEPEHQPARSMRLREFGV
jgi:tetratricopeptide (TPR) repeat protein